MFFWNSLAFSMIQWMLAIWSLVPLPFLNPAWTSVYQISFFWWRFSPEPLRELIFLPWVFTGVYTYFHYNRAWSIKVCMCPSVFTVRLCISWDMSCVLAIFTSLVLLLYLVGWMKFLKREWKKGQTGSKVLVEWLFSLSRWWFSGKVVIGN